jgi:SAM-dependent methyltransferase
MKLAEFDSEQAVPWAGGGKIPWHDPAFSGRMLREHLSQEHDRASRRFETIEKHVSWIHSSVLGGSAARVLDLGCGPGFYAARLARLGHTCVGIDISPASISHARLEAEREALACEYRLEDLCDADLGSNFDCALLIFGELNAFPARQAETILTKARHALSASGVLVLEVHTEDHVRSIGARPPTWFSARRSVFLDEPHICLEQRAWHPESRATTEQYFVVSLRSAKVDRYVSTSQAYSDSGYASLLHDVGFNSFEHHASLTGDPAEAEEGLFVLTARTE